MRLYDTVTRRGEAEQTIRKSRFIATAEPCSAKEDAEAFIVEISRRYRDATHNVPAYVIGGNFQIQWASDNGEPKGTAGAPIVKMLVDEGITNVAIVVTRYFGGIKLGTGGLVRAYTSSAKLGITAAGRSRAEEKILRRYAVDYGAWSRIEHYDFRGRAEVRPCEFAERVTLEIVSEESDAAECAGTLSKLTNGSIELLSEEKVIRNIPVGQIREVRP